MAIEQISSSSTWGTEAAKMNRNFQNLSVDVEKAKNASTRNKGLFPSESELKSAIPSPVKGDWAVVGNTIPGTIYRCTTNGAWTNTGQQGGGGDVDLTGYTKKTDFDSFKSSAEGNISNLQNEQTEQGETLSTLQQTQQTQGTKLATLEANTGYVTCSTAADTAAKTVTKAGFVISTGCRLLVRMTNANAVASPTLNVNNTGAKAIYYNGAVASADNTWEAGEVLDIYYNGTNYQASNVQGGSGKAEKVTFNNAGSGLESEDVQAAIEELAVKGNEQAASTNYLVCSTGAGTAAKTIANPGFVLTTGCRLIVKMNNANTAATATLNVNNTGAKALYYNEEAVSSGNSWDSGEVLDVYYDGTNYRASNMKGSSGGNVILTWNTDVATTRKGVKQNKRKAGLIISYNHPDNGWINEQYIGTSFTDANWQNNTYWRQIADNDDITEIEDGHLESMRTIVNEIGQVKQEMTESISDVEETLSGEIQQVDAKYNILSEAKQDKLIAGENIHIDPDTNTISTDKVEVVQETGTSQSATMSQKAISDNLTSLDGKINAQKSEVDAAKEAAIEAINEEKQGAIADFSAQKVTPEMLSESVKQLIGNSGEKTITNLPDDEDIATTGGNTPVLKFKDKVYDPSGFSGLATKILRKNISGNNNVLTQEMVSDANTIYEIRYDFDLNGTTITVPDNCALKFNGGSIDNGTLKGTGTMLEANLYQIFGENLVFSGTFNIDEVYAEWWGAKSYVHKQSKINSDFPFWDTPEEVEALPDCSYAFNKALDFCGKYAGGVVRALATMYKVENTITIPAETSLYTEESTYFIVYMQGDGKTVVTQNLDTYKFSSETLDENAYTLDFNQLIATGSMAVAFKMNSRRTSFKGRGTISINHSRYTIGLLINGNYYDGVDMSFRPYVDIRSVGGDWGQLGIDTGTEILNEGPTDENLNETGETLYAWNKNTSILYSKANGQTAWKNEGYRTNYFNTSVRIDIDGGDCRLINPYICFGDARGFRGLEIYVHNGAWFNISTFEGCISYKHGGFISIFTDSAVVAHDWQKVQCQLDKTQYDCKFFYAAKAEYIQVAAESDLPYISMKDGWKAFYLGKGTINITIPSIGGSLGYVEDLGNNNNYNMYSLNPSSYQDVYSNTYFNALEGNDPLNARVLDVLKVNILKEKVAADELDTITDNIENVNDKDISYLFDGDPSTKETLIDIDNGIYGTVMTLLNGDSGTNFISTSIAPQWIEVDYYIHSDNSDGIYLVMGGSIGITKTSLIKKKLNRSIYERVEKLFIPVGSIGKDIKMAIVSTVETSGLKVYVYAIRYWVNSYRYNASGAAFAEKNILKEGERIFSNSNEFINTGDAKDINLKRLEANDTKNIITQRIWSEGIIILGSYINNLGKFEHLNFNENQKFHNDNTGSYENKVENFTSLRGKTVKTGEISDYAYSRLLLQNIRSIEMAGFYGYAESLKGIESVVLYGDNVMFDTEDISRYLSNTRVFDLQTFKSNGSGKKIPLYLGNFKVLETLKITRPDANVFKVYGNLANLPYSLKTISLNSCDTSELTYSSKPYSHAWNEEFSVLSIDTECTSMTTDMVDALLIDLAWCVKAKEGTQSISLPKMKRTIASDGAVAVLEELGFTVNVPIG